MDYVKHDIFVFDVPSLVFWKFDLFHVNYSKDVTLSSLILLVDSTILLNFKGSA